MYEKGLGTKKDYSEAMKWFLKASKKGSVKSFEYLGYMYGKTASQSVVDDMVENTNVIAPVATPVEDTTTPTAPASK